ncbi:RNA polymerase sigma-70 factor [uncultured Bacteroides sp.]|uniref:RNA polymerase sigma-70 factor n=1 Tax=uncultured Bacteroides sp. TaxID=162156 RepID=UPI002AAC0384|nr:RNA polymerase sigma-70 factor [uncultured Bacteroides sp.]
MKNEASIQQDKILLFALCKSDSKAFDTLFRKYYRPLCVYAYRFVDLTDAEEIVQDILLWLWENRENFSIQSSLSSYLFRAVYYRCLSCIEQKDIKHRIETLYWGKQSQELPSDMDALQVNELILRIRQAIEKLPESYRKAFVLHRFKDRSYKEIALQLNVSPKTVDYRIQQALKLLREDLKDYFPLLFLLSNILH